MHISTTNLAEALKAAIEGGYVAEMSGQTYTVSAPIVIHVTSSSSEPIGIDLGGAKIVSQITNGAPVIQIVAWPGVDLRYLTLSNFTIEGNGREGDGIQIVADGNDRWVYNFNIDNVTVKNVGGYGLDLQGSVFEGLISNSWMTGNGAGGAYFGHSGGGGQVSALRWYGGGVENNGGAGVMLGAGMRDLVVDGVSIAENNGPGISAEWGITSVSDSQFRDNQDAGIWFWNYGNFVNNTFTTSGVQAVGIDTYVTNGVTLIGNRSVYTGEGTNPATLANVQGFGDLYTTGNTGTVVAGSSVAVSGVGGGNGADLERTGAAVVMPTLTGAGSGATAPNSTGTGAVETALRNALTGGTVGYLSGESFTVNSTIVINLTGSSQGPIGLDLGGAEIISGITNGRPVIEIIVGAGVDVSALTLSNFMINGNGQEGAGIRIVANGADRSINLDIDNVNIEHVGGVGLDVVGNVSGTVFNSWMHGNGQGGARFANSAGGGTADGLQWVGGGFRKNEVGGLVLANGARDMTVQGAYFVENYGAGIIATSGITRVEQTGFENNEGAGALVGGSSTFIADSFSTYGPQTTAIGGALAGGKITLIGSGTEYYGGGEDPTVFAHVSGTGTLSIVGNGRVLAGPNITVTGGSAIDTAPPLIPPVDTTPPAVLSIAASGTDISSGNGSLNAGKVVTLTATFSEAVTVAGGAPSLVLNDGGSATYTGGSGTSTLTFEHIVQAGHNVADLAVTSLALNGATIKDSTGNAANLAGAAVNPAGTLRIDTLAATVASIATSGTSIVAGSGTLRTGATVTFTVTMSEAVTVTGTPTLALNTGGIASYSGGSGGTALSFTHIVAAGQNTADLAVTSLARNGGTLRDAAGNDANLASAANHNPPGTLKVDTTVAAPGPTVTARLSDDTGASSNDRITASASLTGTADPNALVRFTVDGQTIAATATANAAGAWSFTPAGLADGQHTIVASQTNAGGGTGSASLAFTLDTTAPSPIITDGVVANGQVTLNGTSSAGDQVSIYGDGGRWLGAASTGANGRWTYVGSSADSTGFGVTGADLAGNTGKGTLYYVPGSGAGPTPEPEPPPDPGQPPAPAGVAITGIAATSGQVTLTGTSDPGAEIWIYDNGSWIGAATTGGNGRWSYSGAAGATATHYYGIISVLDGNETKPTGYAVMGSNGANTLSGGASNDVIAGRGGNDVLTGGAGADTFAFIAAPNATSNVDKITDFTSGTDKIALSRSAFGALPPGDLSAAAFVQAVAAVTAEQHVIYNQAAGILSYDADGSGNGAAIAIAELKPGQVLTAQDIKVV